METTGCECSFDWRRDFIKGVTIVGLVMSLLAMFDIRLPSWSVVILVPLNIAFVVTVYQYIHELKRIKCVCSDSPIRTIMEVVNYVHIILWGWTIITLVFLGINALYSKRNA
jgi:hypothetical protein